MPGLEGLPGGEPGGGPADGERGAFASGGFLGEQRAEDLDRFPPLSLGGRYHLGCVPPDVGQPQTPQQRLTIGGCGATATFSPTVCVLIQ